jgi:hypothetical protein
MGCRQCGRKKRLGKKSQWREVAAMRRATKKIGQTGAL